MIKKKMWIMDEQTFNNFQRYRQERYKLSQLKTEVDDSMVIKYYIYLIVHFFRKRKIAKEDPFSTEKLIHASICFYKRHYLVNCYADGPLLQNALCSIYLSLKINQIPHDQIGKHAMAWKNKNQAFMSQECIHFSEIGYNEKQMALLRGIGFQIGRSPLIPSIQSLFHEIKNTIKTQQTVSQILDMVLEMLRRVYLDDKAIFLFEGPKLGLSIVIYTLKEKEGKLNVTLKELFGEDLWHLIERNSYEINTIIDYISKLKKLEQKFIAAEAKQIKEKILKNKRKTFEVPERKSPKIVPLNYEFEEKDSEV